VNGHIAKLFGDKITLADLKSRRINAFYDYLRSIGDNEQTVLHYHNLLHAMFEYAIKQELFEYNPMQRVDRPTVKRYPASFYSVEEVQTLLAFAKDDPLYIPIVLAVYCGMRRSEALGMTWDCVDFENDKISVQKKVIEISKNGKKQIIVSDELKTESSRRVFAMHPDVKKILLEHKERQEMYRKQFKRSYSKKYLDMVCVDQMGMLLRPNFVTEHFAVLLNKHGLRKIRFHDLRHTCASLLLASDNNMKVIQMWMGHSSMKTTADIYAHLDMSAKNTAAVALAHLFRLDEDDEAEE
jgi:integrase